MEHFILFQASPYVSPYMNLYATIVCFSGFTLPQISVYITHKNLAVRKIMEAMRRAYTKRGTIDLNTSQTTHEANDHEKHSSIVKGKRASFANNVWFHWMMNPVVKVLFNCVICFSISFCWYAFPNFRTQISRPLAYGVRISLQAGATIGFYSAIFWQESRHMWFDSVWAVIPTKYLWHDLLVAAQSNSFARKCTDVPDPHVCEFRPSPQGDQRGSESKWCGQESYKSIVVGCCDW